MDPPTLPQHEVIPLIVSQLCDYGYTSLAQIVAAQTDSSIDLTPSSRLSELLYIAKEQEEEEMHPSLMMPDDDDDDIGDESSPVEESHYTNTVVSKCLTSMDPDDVPETKSPPNYNTWYITTHRAASTCAIFSGDGKYAATGSADASLKVLDTSKMNSRSDEDRPVIRTLYDHTAGVNDLSFHPNGLVLASCSDDQSIKLFDLSKPGVKRSFRYLQDTHVVRSIAFHPSGDFILAGTDHESVRIYDVKKFQCYTASNNQSDLHQGGITKVRFVHNGGQFVTSSLDGSIKIWDVVSGRCQRTIEKAHEGVTVSSVQFSRNGKFVLSSGKDSMLRLWDTGSGKCLMEYKGAVQQNHSLQSSFTNNEDYVLSSDETTNNVVCWDTRTGELVKQWSGHAGIVRCVAASPTEPGFISC
ncbi:1262_t:CDS:10, partial [Ambispora leptoticha]